MINQHHAMCGLIVGIQIAELTAAPPARAVGIIAACTLGSVAPDIDSEAAWLTQRLGPIGWGRFGVCRMVRALSMACGLPAHRGLTHQPFAQFIVCTLAAVAGSRWVPWWTFAAFWGGCVTHTAGDVPTIKGCIVFWPFNRRVIHIAPAPFRFRVGGRRDEAPFETLAVGPALFVGVFCSIPGALHATITIGGVLVREAMALQ